MATNIIIKKLEGKIFDDHIEAEKRLNELGINSDINSETYKDLADQVRDICPCNCRISTRKRLRVEVECSLTGSYTNYYERDGETLPPNGSGNVDAEIIGTGYIEKGSTSGTVECISYFNSFYDSLGYNGCSDSVNKNQSISIQLNEDCTKWIFNFSPGFYGKVSNVDSSECFEHEQSGLGSDKITSKDYPDATSAYPSGTMTLKYENIYYDRSQTGETSFEITDSKYYQTVKVTVIPLDDNTDTNTLNSINSLYSDLNKTLTQE